MRRQKDCPITKILNCLKRALSARLRGYLPDRMKIGFETLSVLAFLIPGFLASLILDHAVFRKARNTAGLIIEALVFSFIIYVVLSVITGKSPVLLTEQKIGDSKQYSIQFETSMMLWLLTLAILLPLVLAVCINNDLTTALLRKFRI